MEKQSYIGFIQSKECLPDRAIPELIDLLNADLPIDYFLPALDALGDTYCHQEPDHLRYDENRIRFPIPNEADLQSALDYQRAYPEEFAA